MVELSGFVRAKEAAKALGIAVSTWWLRVQRGEYPPGIKLSKNATVWKVATLQDLIDRIAATSPKQRRINPCPSKRDVKCHKEKVDESRASIGKSSQEEEHERN